MDIDLSNCDPLTNFTGTFLGNYSDCSSMSNVSDIPSSPKYLDPHYYAVPYRIIGTIFQGFVLVVGKCQHNQALVSIISAAKHESTAAKSKSNVLLLTFYIVH